MGGGGSSSSVPKTPPFKTDAKMPDFIPANIDELRTKAVVADANAYALSDSDFKKRHAGVSGAEKLFEASVLDDWKRKDTLTPALQAEMMRSGVASAASSLGDPTGASSGSTGEAADAREATIARNLGLGILNYQQLQRGNRMASLNMAETIFPRRTFGFGSEGVVNLELANLSGQNNWNQADFQNQLSIDQLNHKTQAQNVSNQMAQGNANASAKSSQNAALIGGGAAIAGALLIAL